jgi:hypothetical protein
VRGIRAAPDVLLSCALFGNITDRDIRRTVQAAPAWCRANATVIWTWR